MNNEKNINEEKIDVIKDNQNNETIKYVSVSKIDENGIFKEAYGYFEPEGEVTFQERIDSLSKNIIKRK